MTAYWEAGNLMSAAVETNSDVYILEVGLNCLSFCTLLGMKFLLFFAYCYVLVPVSHVELAPPTVKCEYIMPHNIFIIYAI